jgi:hypothetical protein
MVKTWSDLPESHVLLKFSAALGAILEDVGYNEVYGVTLSAPVEK